jgi:hypothetical protein
METSPAKARDQEIEARGTENQHPLGKRGIRKQKMLGDFDGKTQARRRRSLNKCPKNISI